jgi:selenophosphate synthetase-related protein
MSILEIEVSNLRPLSVEFTEADLVVTLIDGRRIATPIAWYPRLAKASSEQRQNFEIMPMGIHWPDVDEDLSVAGMLKGNRAR